VCYEVVLPHDREPPAWLPEQARIVRKTSGSSLMEEIQTLDASETLPYDFILTTGALRTKRPAILVIALT